MLESDLAAAGLDPAALLVPQPGAAASR